MAVLSIANVPANAKVIVGVDTHKHTHLARAKDGLGRHLGQLEIATDPGGYAELLAWAQGLGPGRTFGIEGTCSYGAGLARYLHAHGESIIEVQVGEIGPRGLHCCASDTRLRLPARRRLRPLGWNL